MEGPPRVQSGDRGEGNRQPRTISTGNFTGHSSARSNFARPASIPELPTVLHDGFQPQPTNVSSSSRSEVPDLTQDASTPSAEGFTHRSSTDRVHNLFGHSGSQPGLASLPHQADTQPQPSAIRQTATSYISDFAESGMDGGIEPMFGLEPLGYSESVSLLPSSLQLVAHDSSTHPLIHAAMMSNGAPPDGGMPDLALMNDTLSMWSNAPQTFG